MRELWPSPSWPIQWYHDFRKKCILGFLQVILSCFYKGINEVTKFLKIMVDDEEFMTCATKQKNTLSLIFHFMQSHKTHSLNDLEFDWSNYSLLVDFSSTSLSRVSRYYSIIINNLNYIWYLKFVHWNPACFAYYDILTYAVYANKAR